MSRQGNSWSVSQDPEDGNFRVSKITGGHTGSNELHLHVDIHNGFWVWDCGLRNPLIINPFRNPQSQIRNPMSILHK
jgi:hypothetical protein